MTLVVVSEEIPPHFLSVIHRLADEGVPIAAIARSLHIPSDEIRRVIHEAIDLAILVEVPKDDWPPGSKRSQRGFPATSLIHDEERLHDACCERFRTTNLQSAILAILLRRDQCTKTQLHTVIENNRAESNREPTDEKMVDVVICHLRRKLKPFGLDIKTLWGRGYKIDPITRNRAIVALESLTQEAQMQEAA